MHRFVLLSSSKVHHRSSIVATLAASTALLVAVWQLPTQQLSTLAVRRFTTSAIQMSTTTTYSSSSANNAASTTKKGALIFLHGLGDGAPNGWETSLEQQLTRFHSNLSSQNLVYIFPNAPILPISINGGTPMPGWFDLYDWPIDLEATDDPVTMAQSVASTNEIIQKCMADYHLNCQQIIIAGFSQGGAIALLTAYHPKYRVQHPRDGGTGSSTTLGGCINLSGWLPLMKQKDDWNEPSSLSSSTEPSVPLFWGHGLYDEIVLIEHQKAGVDFLTARGLLPSPKSTLPSPPIKVLQYPVGHSSDPNEMKAVADFIETILFAENDASNDTPNKNGEL